MATELFPRRPIDRPHTNIKVDTSAITGASSGSDKLVMLIGSAKGGQPNTVYRVRNYIQAKQLFREGELLDALELAWNPSSKSAGAGDILAMRVEDAQGAKLEKGNVVFHSRLFGNEANQIQVEVETEELAGITTRNLTVSFAPDDYEYVYRNLGTIFTVTYDGNEAYAGIEIVNNQLTLHVGADALTASVTSFNLGGGRYEKANILANAINSVNGFTAVMPGGADKNINTGELDALALTPVTASGVQVTGFLADLERQLRFDEYVRVEVTGQGDLADFGLTNLVGGDDGVVPETWYAKMQRFANEGGFYLVPLTGKQAVHAEALAFVKERSDNGDPMRAIVGAGMDETPEQLLARASGLRDGRASLVGFSGSKTLESGVVKEIPAYMYASQVAGLASGLGIGEAITFKQIAINELSTIYDGGQLDALNSGGVIMAEFVRNRTATKFRIVDDVTTYNDKSDPVRNQMAVGEANDFLVSELKIHLDENFIGTQARNVSASLIKNSIQSFLDQKKRDNEIQDYNPEDVQVVIDGEVADISLVIFPIRSLKKINVSLVYRQQVLSSN